MTAAANPTHADIQRAFKGRLRAGEPLLGTFLKTAAPHATEILGEAGFDFVVVDAEHAPFGRGDIDMLMLAARAADIASLVRVPSADPAHILSALDCGAAGVLVPHIMSARNAARRGARPAIIAAARAVSRTRHAPGIMARSAFRDHIARADEIVTALAMIEDREAIERIDEIFSVEGLNGAFIGRGDLSASLGAATPGDPIIVDLVATDRRGRAPPRRALAGARRIGRRRRCRDVAAGGRERLPRLVGPGIAAPSGEAESGSF